jgi:hypothetical protein
MIFQESSMHVFSETLLFSAGISGVFGYIFGIPILLFQGMFALELSLFSRPAMQIRDPNGKFAT